MEIKKMELNEEMEELMEEEFSKEEKKHNIFCNYEPYSFVASENGNILGMITGYTSYEEVYIDVFISIINDFDLFIPHPCKDS